MWTHEEHKVLRPSRSWGRRRFVALQLSGQLGRQWPQCWRECENDHDKLEAELVETCANIDPVIDAGDLA